MTWCGAAMLLVLDTNIVVAAFRSGKGASAALIKAAVQGRFGLLATATLFFEYEAVVKRAEHLLAAGATSADADAFIDLLALITVPVRLGLRYRPSLPDPDDEFILECAINGQADAIVTLEKSTFTPTTTQFGIMAVTLRQILAMIRA